MTKEFESFMSRNTGLLVFLRWDTVAYLKYLESHYDERKYECAYRLLEAIDNLFEFYQVTFSVKTDKDIPDELFEKSRINQGFLSHIGKACANIFAWRVLDGFSIFTPRQVNCTRDPPL